MHLLIFTQSKVQVSAFIWEKCLRKLQRNIDNVCVRPIYCFLFIGNKLFLFRFIQLIYLCGLWNVSIEHERKYIYKYLLLINRSKRNRIIFKYINAYFLFLVLNDLKSSNRSCHIWYSYSFRNMDQLVMLVHERDFSIQI